MMKIPVRFINEVVRYINEVVRFINEVVRFIKKVVRFKKEVVYIKKREAICSVQQFILCLLLPDISVNLIAAHLQDAVLK